MKRRQLIAATTATVWIAGCFGDSGDTDPSGNDTDSPSNNTDSSNNITDSTNRGFEDPRAVVEAWVNFRAGATGVSSVKNRASELLYNESPLLEFIESTGDGNSTEQSSIEITGVTSNITAEDINQSALEDRFPTLFSGSQAGQQLSDEAVSEITEQNAIVETVVERPESNTSEGPQQTTTQYLTTTENNSWQIVWAAPSGQS